MRRFLVFAAGFVLTHAAWAATYYIDAATGSDSGPGTTTTTAWATLAPVNAHTFRPGDEILFHAGQRWTGAIEAHGNGTREKPVVLGRYGDGAKPLIAGDGVDAALSLSGVSGWTVEDIAITNHGPTTGPHRVGVMIHTNSFSFAIHLLRVDVSDVNGDLDSKSAGGIGVEVWDKSAGDDSKDLARVDDVLIDGCTITHVDGEGIFYQIKKEGHTYPNTNIRLTHTTITDTGRNAVYMRGTLGGMIDHNTVRNAAARKHGNAVCVGWAKDTIVRANEISETGIHTGDHENGAIDVDDGAIGTVVEYNWTHDNAGGSVNAAAMPGINGDDFDTVIRFNLSENDAQHAFAVGGAQTRTAIYNNTVYVGKGHHSDILWAGQFTHHPQLPDGIIFTRNVVFSEGSTSYTLHASNLAVDGNCYLGRGTDPVPKDAHLIRDKTPLTITDIPLHNRSEAARYGTAARAACPAAGNMGQLEPADEH